MIVIRHSSDQPLLLKLGGNHHLVVVYLLLNSVHFHMCCFFSSLIFYSTMLHPNPVLNIATAHQWHFGAFLLHWLTGWMISFIPSPSCFFKYLLTVLVNVLRSTSTFKYQNTVYFTEWCQVKTCLYKWIVARVFLNKLTKHLLGVLSLMLFIGAATFLSCCCCCFKSWYRPIEQDHWENKSALLTVSGEQQSPLDFFS